jgi:hypothetical protein
MSDPWEIFGTKLNELLNEHKSKFKIRVLSIILAEYTV